MREIKYRAWHKEAEKMFYSRETTMSFTTLRRDGEVFSPVSFHLDNKYRHQKIVEYGDDGDTVESLIDLMQYTGLKDKNGVEIYEGDIVRKTDFDTPTYPARSVMVFEDGAFRLDSGSSGDWLKVCHEDTCEVIGNIYENPELLK